MEQVTKWVASALIALGFVVGVSGVVCFLFWIWSVRDNLTTDVESSELWLAIPIFMLIAVVVIGIPYSIGKSILEHGWKQLESGLRPIPPLALPDSAVEREWATLPKVGKMPYAEYLRSSRWAMMRTIMIQRAGYRCQVCYRQGPLEVHHRTYVRRGHEEMSDLTVLCDHCHTLFHHHANVLNSEEDPSVSVDTPRTYQSRERDYYDEEFLDEVPF